MKFPILLTLLIATAAVAQEKPKPATPKPAEAQPATPKVVESKPATPKPGEAAPAPAKPAEKLPSVTTKQEFLASLPGDMPGRMVGEFFELLEKGQIEEAYAGLTKGSKIIEKPEDLRVLKQKTKEAIEAFGTIIGFELFETKPVGSRLIRRTYLSLGSEYPLRWRFYFYNANSRWRLIDMRVDDKLTGMFDEAPESRGDDTHPPSSTPQ